MLNDEAEESRQDECSFTFAYSDKHTETKICVSCSVQSIQFDYQLYVKYKYGESKINTTI